MTIEFPCPYCQQLVRTPDAAAGKKGKCPGCAAVVKIPEAAPPEPRPPERPVVMPAKAGTPTGPAKAGTPTKAVGPEVQPTEDTGPIEFFCSSCGQVVRTPRAAAGKKGKCPHCAEVVQIPLTNKFKPKAAATSQSQPAVPQPAAPKPRPKPAPAPVPEEIGLAPLDDLAPLPDPAPPAKPALQPLPPAPQPVWQQPPAPQAPGFVPLQPLAPLTPLAPLGNDPLGGVAAGNFFGAGAPAPDPFGGLTPLGAPPANDPFGASPFGVPAPSAFGGGSSGLALPPAPISSYQAPVASYSDPGSALILPAIFQLLATAPIALATMGYTVLMVYGMFAAFSLAAELGIKIRETAILFGVVKIIIGVIVSIAQLVVIFGSIKQLQRREFDQVMTANWISVIVPILPFSFPFGIWSLILLHQDAVRRSFRRS